MVVGRIIRVSAIKQDYSKAGFHCNGNGTECNLEPLKIYHTAEPIRMKGSPVISHGM